MLIIIYLTSIILFWIYTLTSCPTVFLGDSGEIITAAYYLGVCHPPGYPVYMLLSKIASLFSSGGIAYRVNLLSGAMASMAFTALYYLCKEFIIYVSGNNRERFLINIPAYIAALVFVLNGTVWQLAVQAKGGIYLTAIFASAVSLYGAFKYLRTGADRYMYLAMYTAGFLPFLHQSASLYSVLSAGICVYKNGKNLNRLAAGAGFFLFSLLTSNYYLFIRNGETSLIAWQGISTAKQVYGHIFREGYILGRTSDFIFPAYIHRMKIFLSELTVFLNLLLLFVVWGAWVSSERKRFALMLLSCYVLNVILFLAASNNISGFEPNSVSTMSMQVSRQMYPLVNILLVLFAAAGVRAFLSTDMKRTGFIKLPVLAGLVLFFIIQGFAANNCSSKFLGYDHAENILKTVDAQSTVFSDEDTYSFNLLYLTKVMHKYSGYKLHDMQACILNTEFYKKALDTAAKVKFKTPPSSAYREKLARREVRVFMKKKAELDEIRANQGKVYYTSYADFVREGFVSLPYGIVFKMYRKVEDFRPSDIDRIYSIRDFFRNRNLNVHYRDIIGRYFMMKGWEAMLINDRRTALNNINFAEQVAGDSAPLLNLLAALYLYAGNDREKAIEYMRKMLVIDPYSLNIKKTLRKMLRFKSS